MSNNTFKNKPYLVKQAGAFTFSFYYKEGKLKRCFLRITHEAELFSLRIAGNTDTYGYLITAAMQDRIDQLQGYATLLYVPALAMTQDQKLTDNLVDCVNGYMERRQQKGAEEAAKITDEQEQSAQVFMEDVAEYADAKSDNERNEIRKKWHEEVKNELEAEEAGDGLPDNQ